MKKAFFLIIALVSLTAAAQSKLDFPARLVVDQARQLRLADDNGTTADRRAIVTDTKEYPAIVELNDPHFDFGKGGIEVSGRIADMAIVNATAAQLEWLAAQKEVKRVALGFDAEPTMYRARPAARVDAMQTGDDGLDGRAFTGKGVLTGLYDTGLDVNHVNFLNSDGTPRTKALWTFASSGKMTAYTDPSAIANFATEDASATHGTHVLGIMSGNYKGPATYSVIENNKNVITDQTTPGSSVPFYGIATDADLAVACGNLTQPNMLNGVQQIVDLAKRDNQPCVVNLSVGSNLGPHDGSDAFSRYLAELGNDAVICISSGNEGNSPIAISTTGEQLKTLLSSSNASSGTVQFWASDSRPFTLRFIGYERTKGEVFSYTVDRVLDVTEKDMSGFTSAFNGSLSISSDVDQENNRYNVSIAFSLTGRTRSTLAGVVIIPASETQTVDGYSNSVPFVSESQPGFTDGTPENAVNGLACGENVIVVGSYVTASNWGILNGSIFTYSPPPAVGAISPFSSYGTTFTGRKLPDVCAPGQAIVSSISKYYMEKAQINDLQLCGYYTERGLFSRNSPWQQMQGTSMASPFVAGIVAAWLEADPSLTVNEVREVIRATAANDIFTSSQKIRWGAGKIDAVAGVKYVLEHAAVNEVAAAPQNAIVTRPDRNTVEIFVPGAAQITGSLYSISGNCVAVASTEGSTLTLSTSCDPGVYILRIDADRTTETRKILL